MFFTYSLGPQFTVYILYYRQLTIIIVGNVLDGLLVSTLDSEERKEHNANHGYSCRKFSLLKGKDLQTRLFFGRFQTLEVLGNLWTSLIQRLSSEVVKIPAGENRYNLYITR